jgi:hypothetical protein
LVRRGRSAGSTSLNLTSFIGVIRFLAINQSGMQLAVQTQSRGAVKSSPHHANLGDRQARAGKPSRQRPFGRHGKAVQVNAWLRCLACYFRRLKAAITPRQLGAG